MPRGGKASAAGVAGVTLGVPEGQAQAADGPWRGEFRSGESAPAKTDPITGLEAALFRRSADTLGAAAD